ARRRPEAARSPLQGAVAPEPARLSAWAISWRTKVQRRIDYRSLALAASLQLVGWCAAPAMVAGCDAKKAALDEFKVQNEDADRYKIPFKAGEACPKTGIGGDFRVLKRSILYCNDGEPAVVTECKGPKGVFKAPEGGIGCDVSANAEGDACHSNITVSTC